MDTIANMLTAITNASRVKKSASIPLSSLKLKILEIFKNEGIVKTYTIHKDTPLIINVEPAFDAIEKIKRISKPGRRLYIKAKQIRLQPGILQVISTPAGILTSSQARKKHVGGELLFEVRS